MKKSKSTFKSLLVKPCDQHMEWDDENEASDGDLKDMSKCIATLVIGTILAFGALTIFLLA